MAKNVFEQYAQEEKKKKALSKREPSNVFEQLAQDDKQEDNEQVPSNVFEQLKQQEQAQAQSQQYNNQFFQDEPKQATLSNQPEESYEQPGRQLLPQTVIPRATNFITPKEKERFGAAAKRGLDRSFIARVAGSKPTAAPNDENWFEHLTSTMAELAGDFPLISAGAKLGAMAGFTGGPIGAAIGGATGAMGAFMLPAAMKTALGEYENWASEGNEGTFRDFLASAGHVGKETAKAGAMGALVGNIGRFLPFLDKLPGMKKILNTNWGRAATLGAAETTGLTLAEAAVNLEAPTWKRLRDNALMIGTMHGAHEVASKIPSLMRKGKTTADSTTYPKMNIEPIIPKKETSIKPEAKAEEYKAVSEIDRFKPKAKVEPAKRVKPVQVEVVESAEPTERIRDTAEKAIKEVRKVVGMKPENFKGLVQHDAKLVELMRSDPKEFLRTFGEKELSERERKYVEWRSRGKTPEQIKKITTDIKMERERAVIEEVLGRPLTDTEIFDIEYVKEKAAKARESGEKTPLDETPTKQTKKERTIEEIVKKPIRKRRGRSEKIIEESLEDSSIRAQEDMLKPWKLKRKPKEKTIKEIAYDKDISLEEKTYGKDTLDEHVRNTINKNPLLKRLAQTDPKKFAEAIKKQELTKKEHEYFELIGERNDAKETAKLKEKFKFRKMLKAIEETIDRSLTSDELATAKSYMRQINKERFEVKPAPKRTSRPRVIRNKNFKQEKANEYKQFSRESYEKSAREKRTPYEQATNQVKESVDILTSAKNDFNKRKPEETVRIPSKHYKKSKVFKYIPEQALKAIGARNLNPREQLYFEWVEENVGERDAKLVESQFKWNKELAAVQKELGRKMTKQEANDTIYYRQQTGNPKIKGDTFEALSKRLPDPLKKSIQMEIDRHFKATKKALNDNPLMRDIHEREGLADTYLTGMYKYDAKKFAKADAILQKQFRTANEFANMKEFTTFAEAFEKAGLEPLYDNIYDAMRLYDKRVIERVQNAELMDQISKYQDENNTMLIRVPKNVSEFNRMEAQGFEPFYDRYLRGKFARVNAEGVKPEILTEFPAMVDPDLAQAMQGIFKRNINDKITPIGKLYDKLGNFLKQKNVYGSFFHYLPLSTSAIGTPLGWSFLNPMWLKRGKQFRGDVTFMKDAMKHGLAVDTPKDFQAYETSTKVLDKVHDWTKKHAGTTATLPVKLLRQTNKMFGYMFSHFQPRLKLVVWDAYNKHVIDSLVKAGETMTPARVSEIKRGTAKVTNNVLGGQKWETMPGLNSARSMKNLRRGVAYPDWNLSSLRQFLLGFKTPEYLAKLERTTAGKKAMVSLGKKYWFKWGINAVALTAAAKYFFSGIEQTDKDASILGLRFNPKKAWDGLAHGDPSKLSYFALIDAPIRIPGTNYIFNMGRDSEGRKIYGRIGKQLWENFGWMTNPLKTGWGKSNPVPAMVAKHLSGLTPTDDGWFNVRGKYQGNVRKSWDATERLSFGRLVSHAKELTIDLIAPYSFSTIEKKGIAPWLLTGLGMIPLSQGISPYTARPLIKKALQKKDYKSLNMIKMFLRGNEYKESEINRKITTIRNELDEK